MSAAGVIGCSAIYQIILGWKTYQLYYETDELPNPRPTKTREKIRLKAAFWATLSIGKYFFRGVRIDFYLRNRLRETQPNQIFLRKHPVVLGFVIDAYLGVHGKLRVRSAHPRL